ncbi:ATP-dependent DNA helicase RRM3-like [Lactuca sativa]|nr:ATP-dependent DNA helicase RRM3-like [Lactuca sativa]
MIREAQTNKKQFLLFVYGHGGTGKTFLWTTILTYFRSIGKIVLAVATSDIASFLLPFGRTTHSRFNIPHDLPASSICNIRKNTQLGDLLQQTSFIIWDEAPMSDKRCFECLDRTLKYILNNKDLPFGGMSMLLGGDFRQTLPVKLKTTVSEIISSTSPNSYMWPYFTVCKLLLNMLLSTIDSLPSSSTSAANFASWLLDIGNGKLGEPDAADPIHTSIIDIPDPLLISSGENSLHSLIRFVYDVEVLVKPSTSNLSSRAIVCPKNDIASEINSLVMKMANGNSITYLSTNSMTPHTHRISDIDLLYPQEYLHRLTFSSFPLHELTLKPNTPVMLLKNINQGLSLCNGTRLIVSQLLPTVIQASIITGTSVGNRVYIPRIKFVHNSPDLPFVFTRKQFPVKVCYAMTINKSQGQSLKTIGITYHTLFSHMGICMLLYLEQRHQTLSKF